MLLHSFAHGFTMATSSLTLTDMGISFLNLFLRQTSKEGANGVHPSQKAEFSHSTGSGHTARVPILFTSTLKMVAESTSEKLEVLATLTRRKQQYKTVRKLHDKMVQCPRNPVVPS
jgi:hypothetical protein